MQKIRVIILEEQRLLREVLAFLLTLDEQFEVVAAGGDARQMLPVCEQFPDALILVSTHMEPLDGCRFTELIRGMNPSALVIGIAGTSMPILVRKFMKTGARGYITRQASRIELMDAIQTVCKGGVYICDEVKNKMATEDFSIGENSGWNSLTKMELVVIDSIKKGLTAQDAADQLGVSRKTIEAHRYRIFKKLQIKNAAALVAFAHQEGI